MSVSNPTILGTAAGTGADGTATEYAFSTWKDSALPPCGQAPQIVAGTVAGTQVFAATSLLIVGGANSAAAAFYFDPADYAGSRTLKVRVRGTVVTNATAPGINFTFGLYPVTVGGASGTDPFVVSPLGTVVTSVAINTPGGNTATHGESTATTLSSAGFYVLGITFSGTTAANSTERIMCRLQYQQV